MKRVVVTGMGVVTPIGIGWQAYWESLIHGVCGLKPITAFDTTGHKAKLAGEVQDFAPEDFMEKKDARRNDRYCQMAIAAANMAMSDAGDTASIDRERFGAYVASGIGGLLTFEQEHAKLLEKGPGRISPFFIPMMISNMAAGMISMIHGLKGATVCPVSACATGTQAIGEAFFALRRGELDACLAGGAEAAITPLALAGFANMTALSEADDPDLGLLPFDSRRNGFLMGEGAGVILLETLESAEKRGATVYAELTGYASTSDAYHITAPDPEGAGAARAMRGALGMAELRPEQLSYINAHGTGTPINDRIETCAIKGALGAAARTVAISSTKSMTGHLLGAAGGVEAIASVLACREDIIPPTIHLLEPDPGCDLDYVPLVARHTEVSAALSNSMGFGGHNASLLFEKFSK